MKPWLIIILFFKFSLSYLPVLGQQQYDTAEKISELKIKLTDDNLKKEKGDILLQLTELYWKNNPQKAIKVGKESIGYFEKNNPKKLPDALINTAISFYYNGNVDSTIVYTLKIFSLNSKYLSTEKKGVSYNLLSVAYKHKSDYPNSLAYGTKAIATFRQVKDSLRLAGALDNIASTYRLMGNYEQALSYSLDGLQIFENQQDSTGIARCLANISTLYSNLKDYKKSKEYHQKTLLFALKIEDAFFLADTYNNYAAIFNETNQLDSAYFYYQKALNLYQKVKSPTGMATVQQNLGELYLKQGEVPKSIAHLTQAYTLFHSLSHNADLVDACINLAEAYQQANNFDQALQYYNQAVEISQKIGNVPLQKRALKGKQQLLIENKLYKEAYSTLRSYYQLKDSIENVDVKEKVAELDKKYQTEKKEKEIAHLKISKQKQKNTLYFLSIGIITLFLFSFFWWNFLRNKRKREAAYNKLKVIQMQQNEKQLRNELEFKNRELATKVINIQERNNLLKEYLQIINNIKDNSCQDVMPELNHLKREIKAKLNSKKEWDDFQSYFEQVNADFSKSLFDINQNLTENDFRLATLLKLGMNNHEISGILSITSQSTKNALYRLKNKLKLDKHTSLRSYIRNL